MTDMTQEKDNICNRLREIRQSKGLTVNKFAEKIGEDHQKVGRIERGRRNITIDYLVKVSRALGTSVEDLLKKDPKVETTTIKHTPNSNKILNQIVIKVEERAPNLSPEKKGQLISRVFERVSNVSSDQQDIFLEAFFEGLSMLQ